MHSYSYLLSLIRIIGQLATVSNDIRMGCVVRRLTAFGNKHDIDSFQSLRKTARSSHLSVNCISKCAAIIPQMMIKGAQLVRGTSVLRRPKRSGDPGRSPASKCIACRFYPEFGITHIIVNYIQQSGFCLYWDFTVHRLHGLQSLSILKVTKEVST